jgi:hypothetical protein
MGRRNARQDEVTATGQAGTANAVCMVNLLRRPKIPRPKIGFFRAKWRSGASLWGKGHRRLLGTSRNVTYDGPPAPKRFTGPEANEVEP